MNPATNSALRVLVELHGRADLLHHAVLQHHDAVGHGHGLDLVVRHIDHGGVGQLLLELADLHAHLHAQRRIEVRQRFVEQEHLRIAHDGAADGDALALAARERLGQTVQILGELQLVGGRPHLLVELRLGHVHQLQGVGHVVVHGHVRVERIGLEHHRDAALGRRHVVDDAAVDLERSRRDRLEAGDAAKQRGLAAA